MPWISTPLRAAALLGAALSATVLGGCGSSTSTHAAAAPAPATGSPSAGSRAAGVAPLSADARSAATGDIPDNQVFLTFTDPSAGFTMKYPEGWTRSGAGSQRRFTDKNNLVSVRIAPGAAPTPATVTAALTAAAHTDPTLRFGAPKLIRLPAGPAVRVVYDTESAPNPVTGRRVRLIVDRYELARSGRLAVVDLGTPVGVDNVDAYRMMIDSFGWR